MFTPEELVILRLALILYKTDYAIPRGISTDTVDSIENKLEKFGGIND